MAKGEENSKVISPVVDEAAIDEAYAKAAADSHNGKVSVQSLLDKTGVTSEDFQAVSRDHPEIIQNIGGGATCHFLTLAADKVKCTKSSSSCHTGVKKIHSQAKDLAKRSKDASKATCTPDSLFTKEAKQAEYQYLRERPYQRANGGCSTATMLKASGDYVVIDVENKAYGKNKGCSEDKQMNDLFGGIQPGVTISIDSIEDKSVRKQKGNTAGGIYGHDAVKRSDGHFGCDFNQVSINFARYGEYAHVCFPKDAYVSEEYAKMLIREAQMRTNGVEQTTENSSSISERNDVANDMKNSRGQLPENKSNREGEVVALKSGPLEVAVGVRNAQKELEDTKTDERSLQTALRDGKKLEQPKQPITVHDVLEKLKKNHSSQQNPSSQQSNQDATPEQISSNSSSKKSAPSFTFTQMLKSDGASK